MSHVLKILALVLILSCTTTSAKAIDWPVQYLDAQQKGESMSPDAILAQPEYQLAFPKPAATTPPQPDYQAYAVIETPFETAAIAYSYCKAKYINLDAETLRQLQQRSVLQIDAYAWSDRLDENEEMTVVLKQKGNVVHAQETFDELVSPSGVDYLTRKKFTFPLSAFDYHAPFSVVIANASVNVGDGLREATWNVDPSTFR